MKNLQAIRKQKKLSQAVVADYIGVDRTTYSNYETGKRDPDTDTVVKLAEYFAVSTDYLLGNTNDPTPPDAKKAAPTLEEVEAAYVEALIQNGFLTKDKPYLTDEEIKRLRKSARIALED